MKTPFTVLIAGAGLVGMALAARLASGRGGERLAISLVDAGQVPRFSVTDDVLLRVSALSAGSMTLLAGLGVRERIVSTRACPYRDMVVWDAGGTADGPETLNFSAAELAMRELGYIVENELLRHCLLERLRELGVELLFQTPISAIGRRQHGFEVTLDNGERREPALLVGADGADSVVRQSAGIDVDGWRYPQCAVVTHARPERSHRNAAWQRFLPDGPLALLPLSDGRVSIVWSTTPERAGVLKSADDATFGRELSAASDHVLGALRIEAPRASFPLGAQHARRYVRNGVALIGDAAHTVHPLAGQGANLGLADALTLARTVENALENGEYPADLPVLRRYERARSGANKTMLYFIDGLHRLFGGKLPGLARLRGGGMRLFNQSGPLRRQAMRVALGLDNDARS